jgi:hypothetical protein
MRKAPCPHRGWGHGLDQIKSFLKSTLDRGVVRREDQSCSCAVSVLFCQTSCIAECTVWRECQINHYLGITSPITTIQLKSKETYAGSLNTSAASIFVSGVNFLNSAGWSFRNGQRLGKFALTSVAVQTFLNPYRSATFRHFTSSFEKMTTLGYFSEKCLYGV